MGLSSKDSRIFFVPLDCPISLNGNAPSGTPRGMNEQVTRIEINPSVSQRKYGHDKSFGAQDVCSGIKSWDGSITTKIASGEHPFTFSAGDTVWVEVYPIGVDCGEALRGYAVIDSDPIVCNLENGEPVEHNYRFSSKGMWRGFPSDGRTWGGLECQCGNTGGGGSGGGGASFSYSGGGSFSGANVPAVEGDAPNTPITTPVTAYQWNGTRWTVVLDECREGFVPGAAPVDNGTFIGQLSFVECEVG